MLAQAATPTAILEPHVPNLHIACPGTQQVPKGDFHAYALCLPTIEHRIISCSEREFNKRPDSDAQASLWVWPERARQSFRSNVGGEKKNLQAYEAMSP